MALDGSHWSTLDYQAINRFLNVNLYLETNTDKSAYMNDTLIKSLESVCQERSIDFITKNNHVRCLAHIINLATQAALSSLKVEYVENENILLNDTDEITKVIPKVRLNC
ncbi:hypothetical protein RhiirA5_444021 [Rhizophagus irregularis]|uniref:Uncharacterized protein n=1 Tax=Rhizophagus irregularis TaxID=588596 RepID=A0A2N0NDG7_9GLOM|nr:hypothetical protein RhiirA5_444021 [Rhizophagus irregularis]PKC54460.1 hypothetical protein RhiirA1_477280 [Rhizophagus irregularis]